MSQAEALLNSLSDEQVSTYASPASTGEFEYFEIGEDRIINVPENQKKLGVQYDDNVNTVSFRAPRYYDGRDLSKMKIYINYELPNGDSAPALAENVTTITEASTYIYFDWTITAPITQYKGNIKFLVCARRTDDKGIQINHWNSELCTECYISEGLEVGGGITQKQYNDLTTKLLEMMTSIESNLTGYRNQQAEALRAEVDIMKQELLVSIPEDYITLNDSVDNANRTRAAAIVNDAEGNILAITDSSHSPLSNLRIFGKTAPTNTTGSNLLSKAEVKTFLNNAGSQKTGIAIPIEYDGIYTYYISDTVTAYIGYTNSLTSNATHFTSALNGCPATGTVELKRTQYFLIWFDSNVTFTEAGKYFLGRGENLPYEPFTGKQPGPTPEYPITIDNLGVNGPIDIDLYGRNLIVSSVTTYPINGITIDQNPDGSFHVYGTATSLAIPRIANIILKSGKQYILSGGSTNAQVTVRDSGATFHFATSYGDPTTFTVKEDSSASIYIRVDSGVTVDTTIYPMLQLADFKDATFDLSNGRQTLRLTLPYGLSGIDELGVYDEIDLERGVHIHRIARANLLDKIDLMDIGDNTRYSDTIARFDFGHAFGTLNTDPVYCNRFMNKFAHGDDASIVRATECISSHSVNDLVSVFIRKDRMSSPSIEGFTEWLENNETIIQYRLAEPYETELTPTEIAAYKALMTNYPYTTVCNNVSANMIASYIVDTKAFIIQNGGNGGSAPGGSYSKAEIDQMFGSYVTDVANLIGGVE